MFNVPKISLSHLSSGMTAFVCAGFLVNAIMTDNGGAPDAQEKWRTAKENAYSIVDSLGPQTAQRWKDERETVDQNSTASIVKIPDEPETPVRTSDEPSVLSLIKENADVAPGVSSGTDRVSVIVKKGDTLFGIARRHGLTVNEIARLNSLEEPFVIKIGQTLYVAR